MDELLTPDGLAESGVFDPRRVAGLARRCAEGRVAGVRESMALVGVLSTGLWHRELVGSGPASYPEETADPRVMIDRTVVPLEEALA